MTGHLTALGETVQVNTVLIQGQIAVSSVADCGEYLDHNSSPSSPPPPLLPGAAVFSLTLIGMCY